MCFLGWSFLFVFVFGFEESSCMKMHQGLMFYHLAVCLL
jgi:hypothetical protein